MILPTHRFQRAALSPFRRRAHQSLPLSEVATKPKIARLLPTEPSRQMVPLLRTVAKIVWKRFSWLTARGVKRSNARKRIRIRGRRFAPLGSSLFRTRESQNQRRGKGRTMNPLIESKNAAVLPVLIALTLGYFGLSPTALTVNPTRDEAIQIGTPPTVTMCSSASRLVLTIWRWGLMRRTVT